MDKKLDNKTVMRYWNKLDRPSLQAVRDATGKAGWINPASGNPYSRQWIRVLMSETPAGRAALGRPTSSASLRVSTRRPPLIVSDDTKILEWYRDNGMIGIEVISPDKVTVPDVHNRYVYGDLPLTLALEARSVYMPTETSDGLRLREYKVTRII